MKRCLSPAAMAALIAFQTPALAQTSAASSPAVQAQLAAGRAAHDRKDFAGALGAFRPLADQGVSEAQFWIAVMAENAEGGPKDSAMAQTRFRKAAVQGFARAQRDLGLMYQDGEGVTKNDVTAAAWYRKASDQGYGPAQTSLAFAYALGKGVPDDIVQADMWFILAAQWGVDEAADGRRLAKMNMTPAQIAGSQRLARAWKAK